MSNTLRCSFCGKREHEVTKLVAGPKVFICDECVVAYEAMYGEKPPKRQHQKPDKDKRKNT